MTGAGARASVARGGGGGGGVDGTDREHPIVTAAAASSATLLAQMTGRRQKLPVPKTETEGINLWNLGRHSRHSKLGCKTKVPKLYVVFIPTPYP